MGKKYYSLEFKIKALEMARANGIPATASELRIPRQRLYEWFRDENYLMDCYAEQMQERNTQ